MKDVPPLRECERALTLEPRWRAPRVEEGLTCLYTRQSTRVTSSCFQADAAMGKARMRLSHRGLRLHAKVIPVAFPSGKTGHIFGAVNANLEWTRISDEHRPQAWKRGSPDPEPGDQPDHAPRYAPVKQQLFHKVPRREVGVPLRCCPPRMAGLAKPSTATIQC